MHRFYIAFQRWKQRQLYTDVDCYYVLLVSINIALCVLLSAEFLLLSLLLWRMTR
jgi:hypothetical protein